MIGVYRGHFLDQGLAACYLLKPGRPEVPILYRVERNSDGRGFAARTIKASQDGQHVLAPMASFTLFEPGDADQKTMRSVLFAALLIVRREATNELEFSFPMSLNRRVDR
jgi:acyl-CoA thioesterase-2